MTMSGGRSFLIDNPRPFRIGGLDTWETLKLKINNKEVIPIISNSFYNNLVYDIDFDGHLGTSLEADSFAINDQLAADWATFIGYPLKDDAPQFSRIAQYNLVKNRNDANLAKRQYLAFVKMCLLNVASRDEGLTEELKEWVNEYIAKIYNRNIVDISLALESNSFSYIAHHLKYPRFSNEQNNPLNRLAELPLPIYITTSYHDFIERALAKNGKHPRVQICPWNGDSAYTKPHWFDPTSAPQNVDVENLDADETTPLVYHLYGLEKEPSSLVISEDDFMEFLIKVSVNKNTIPETFISKMTQSSLLMLGYRLSSWDFRVLFKGVIKQVRDITPDGVNFAVQLDPAVMQSGNPDQNQEEILNQAREYIQAAFFKPSQFEVQWKNSVHFVEELMNVWEGN